MRSMGAVRGMGAVGSVRRMRRMPTTARNILKITNMISRRRWGRNRISGLVPATAGNILKITIMSRDYRSSQHKTQRRDTKTQLQRRLLAYLTLLATNKSLDVLFKTRDFFIYVHFSSLSFYFQLYGKPNPHIINRLFRPTTEISFSPPCPASFQISNQTSLCVFYTNRYLLFEA